MCSLSVSSRLPPFQQRQNKIKRKVKKNKERNKNQISKQHKMCTRYCFTTRFVVTRPPLVLREQSTLLPTTSTPRELNTFTHSATILLDICCLSLLVR